MTDLENILPLWRELEAAGSDYVLATIVGVEGSSYRKPGARMLIAQDGRRAGTVSGGCLEAEVAKRAWWLTADGPVVERYSTIDDDGDLPYGSGCGGIVFILLERSQTARPAIVALAGALDTRSSLAIAVVLQGPHTGCRNYAMSSLDETQASSDQIESLDSSELFELAQLALSRGESIKQTTLIDGQYVEAWADYRTARPGLWIFGAGDDAKPLVRLARELGWFVGVADGRSNLATKDRFPLAHDVRILPEKSLLGESGTPIDLRPSDAAVLMTHSFEQDTYILASLLSVENAGKPGYIGVLGPQRRTREALSEAARVLKLSSDSDRVDRWLQTPTLHAPMGLDLGADTPASIALSILAEIQKTLHTATALPLREVRALKAADIEF